MSEASKKAEPAPVQSMVILRWDDSFGGGHWFDKDEYTPKVAKCVTAGMVIDETDEHITVTCSMTDGDDGQYYAPMTIPKSCITSRRDIEG